MSKNLSLYLVFYISISSQAFSLNDEAKALLFSECRKQLHHLATQNYTDSQIFNHMAMDKVTTKEQPINNFSGGTYRPQKPSCSQKFIESVTELSLPSIGSQSYDPGHYVDKKTYTEGEF